MRFQPQCASGNGRVDFSIFPPPGFITIAMDLAVMAAAQWHGELITHLAAKCAVLREAQLMGIRGPPTANQTRLFGHKLDVNLVTKAARLGMGQLALVFTVDKGRPSVLCRPPLERQRWLRCECIRTSKRRQLGLERILDLPSIGCR